MIFKLNGFQNVLILFAASAEDESRQRLILINRVRQEQPNNLAVFCEILDIGHTLKTFEDKSKLTVAQYAKAVGPILCKCSKEKFTESQVATLVYLINEFVAHIYE